MKLLLPLITSAALLLSACALSVDSASTAEDAGNNEQASPESVAARSSTVLPAEQDAVQENASEVPDSSGQESTADTENQTLPDGRVQTFGRWITVDEFVEMLQEQGGRDKVVDAMVASTTSTETQAGCMLDNLSYETFVVVANAEQPTNSQRGELLSALELCGLPTG